jgi:PAS domain S-box-containing protein
MWRHSVRRPLAEEPTEVSQSLETIVWILMSASLLLLIGIINLPLLATRWLGVLGAIYAVCITTFVLNRRGHTRFAGVFLIVGLWLTLTGAALTAGGISSFAPIYYVTIVFVAGLLFGHRAAIATAVVCILTAFGLVLIELTGRTPSSALSYTPIARWSAITLLTVIVMGLQYLSLRKVNDALKSSREELEERRRTDEELGRISERLQLATKAANIGIWDWDVKNDKLVWDEAMYRLYGVKMEDFSSAFDAWVKSVAPEDFERANAQVQAALRGERFEGEFRIVWPDGSVHFIKAASQTFRDETGDPVRMVGVNYDITERKLAEERITLMQTITMDVASAEDLSSALEVVLRRVCEKTGWALGQAWVPNDEGTALSCCPAWFATDPNLEEFRTYTKNFRFNRGVGLPGSVWALRQPVWMADVTKEPNFPRVKFAEKCGLKAGLGVPILSGNEVTAVLEFFLRETREEDERLVKVISAVAAQIDLMVERRRAEAALRESEAKFRVLTETAASAILIFQDGKYRYANPAAEAITGYKNEEILEMGLSDLVHPEFREMVEARALARQRGESVPVRYEVKIIDKNANERWLDVAATLTEFQGRPANLVSAFDITERKRAEQALQRSEDLFRAIVEDQTEMIVRWKPDGTRTFVNQAYCRVFGCTPANCIGTSFYPQIVGEYRERIREKIRLLTPDNPIATEIHESITGSGELRWQEWTDRGIFDSQGNLLELQSTGRDITERKRAEEQLLFSREQLRALSERLRRVKEEEAVRIARELHDELGSALTSLKWSLLDLKKIDQEPDNTEKIGEMLALVDNTINVVRRISSELRPGVLDDLGLVSAIEWHCQQFQGNTGIACESDLLVDDVDLNREQSTVVFRILQEAMTNILRHAQASRVRVLIEEEDGGIVLEVQDNGRGITESEKLGAHSLGLLGMRERANSIGGSIDISGTSGGGTKLVLHVPVNGKSTDVKTKERLLLQ